MVVNGLVVGVVRGVGEAGEMISSEQVEVQGWIWDGPPEEGGEMTDGAGVAGRVVGESAVVT